MSSEKPRQVAVEFTPEFKRNIRRLARKYRRIRSDVAPVISQIEQGETPGDQIQRTGYTLFKVRIRNSNGVSVIHQRGEEAARIYCSRRN